MSEPSPTRVRRLPVLTIVSIGGLVVLQGIFLYLAGPTLLRGPWWMLLLVIGTPIAFLATMVWKLLSRQESPPVRALTASERRWNAVLWAISLPAIWIGAWYHMLWLMGAGMMLPGLSVMLRNKEGKFQFSLRRAFFVTTFIAIVLMVMILIQRETEVRLHEIQLRGNWTNYQIRLDGLRTMRENLEAARNKVTPQYYQQQRAALDQQEQTLGPPPPGLDSP